MSADGLRQRIKERRLALGLSQQALANKLGVISLSVSNWERGTKEPWNNIVALAKALGVSTDWLLTGEETTPPIAVDTSANERAAPQSKKAVIEWLKDLTFEELQAMAEDRRKKATHEHDPPMKEALTPTRGRGGGEFESSRLFLTETEAAEALKWVRRNMQDLPRESDIWPALHKLSKELGRQCDPRFREAHRVEATVNAGSAAASAPLGAAAEVRVGKLK